MYGVATMKEISLSYDSITRPAIQERLIEIMRDRDAASRSFS
jgi:hypothetical protein